MDVVTLTGSHYTIGLEHGKALFQRRRAIWIHMRTAPVLDQRQCDALRGLLTEYSPRTLDLVAGIADGFQLPPQALFAYVMLPFRTWAGDGCSVWAAGGLLAKNRDYWVEHRELQFLQYCRPERGYAYLAVSSTGHPNVFSSGLNCRGLAVADARVPVAARLGLPRFSLMMHILEDCSSVRQAVQLIRSVPSMGDGNLVLADALGQVAVVELGDGKSAQVTVREEEVAVATNHFESMGDLSDPRWADSIRRFAHLRSALNENHIGWHFAHQLMAAHSPVRLCIHGSRYQGHWQATIATSIYWPARLALRLCSGLPCQDPFQLVRLAELESGDHLPNLRSTGT